LVDLGEHRLKDLSRREHLYQLAIGGLNTSFPTLRTLESAPHNLPVYFTSFVGRQREMDELSLLITQNRLVTLRGPGGIGKTRLATQAAAELLEEFPDGIWMVDLSATDDPDLVPTLVAEALGVRDLGGVGGRPLSEILSDYAADKQMLLLLDNCEHLLESSSRFIAEVMQRGAGVHVVATSRDALTVPGAQYHVPSLRHEAVDAGESEAVRLFVERAGQVNPAFWVDGSAVEPVVEIARRLDGLPLAIELAAARVNVLTPQQILDRLEDRFALLKSSRTGAPERHETLLATMDWSYDLLTEAERETLQQLSVFSGWTLEAAEAVLGDRAVDLLGSLADRSLVEVAVEGDGHRYRLLETIRQYGQGKLADSGNEPTARAAHADFFLEFAEAGERGLRGMDQAAWMRRIESDHDNIRSAIGWAMEAGDHDLALRLVAAMSWYWFIDGYWQGPLQLFHRVYDESGDADPLLRARAAYKAGGVAVIWGWYDEMAPLIEAAYETLRDLGDERDVAFATHFMGGLAAVRGDSDATDLLAESIALFRGLGDDWGEAFAERWVGSAAELSGDTTETIEHQRASVATFIRIGDRWAASWIAFVLGYNLVAIDKFDEAQRSFERSLELVAGTEDRLVKPHAKRGLAMVAARTDRGVEARSLLEEAIPLLQRIGDENCIAICQMILGELDLDADSHDSASEHLAGALRGFAQLGGKLYLAPVLRRIAELKAQLGDYERAATLLGAAEATRESAAGVLSPYERARMDRTAKSTAAALGAGDFKQRHKEGTAMDIDEAVSYARQTR
jgi:predicted ATPase